MNCFHKQRQRVGFAGHVVFPVRYELKLLFEGSNDESIRPFVDTPK
jgi:hypothetical protein